MQLLATSVEIQEDLRAHLRQWIGFLMTSKPLSGTGSWIKPFRWMTFWKDKRIQNLLRIDARLILGCWRDEEDAIPAPHSSTLNAILCWFPATGLQTHYIEPFRRAFLALGMTEPWSESFAEAPYRF